MEHSNETEIKCPYCNYVFSDSWDYDFEDYDGDEIEIECGSCEKEFAVTRNITISYDCYKIDCESKKEEHNYRLDRYWISKQERIKFMEWKNLPKEKWKYYRIEQCNKCEKKNYVTITKEDYYKGINNE